MQRDLRDLAAQQRRRHTHIERRRHDQQRARLGPRRQRHALPRRQVPLGRRVPLDRHGELDRAERARHAQRRMRERHGTRHARHEAALHDEQRRRAREVRVAVRRGPGRHVADAHCARGRGRRLDVHERRRLAREVHAQREHRRARAPCGADDDLERHGLRRDGLRARKDGADAHEAHGARVGRRRRRVARGGPPRGLARDAREGVVRLAREARGHRLLQLEREARDGGAVLAWQRGCERREREARAQHRPPVAAVPAERALEERERLRRLGRQVRLREAHGRPVREARALRVPERVVRGAQARHGRAARGVCRRRTPQGLEVAQRRVVVQEALVEAVHAGRPLRLVRELGEQAVRLGRPRPALRRGGREAPCGTLGVDRGDVLLQLRARARGRMRIEVQAHEAEHEGVGEDLRLDAPPRGRLGRGSAEVHVHELAVRVLVQGARLAVVCLPLGQRAELEEQTHIPARRTEHRLRRREQLRVRRRLEHGLHDRRRRRAPRAVAAHMARALPVHVARERQHARVDVAQERGVVRVRGGAQRIHGAARVEARGAAHMGDARINALRVEHRLTQQHRHEPRAARREARAQRRERLDQRGVLRERVAAVRRHAEERKAHRRDVLAVLADPRGRHEAVREQRAAREQRREGRARRERRERAARRCVRHALARAHPRRRQRVVAVHERRAHPLARAGGRPQRRPRARRERLRERRAQRRVLRRRMREPRRRRIVRQQATRVHARLQLHDQVHRVRVHRGRRPRSERGDITCVHFFGASRPTMPVDVRACAAACGAAAHAAAPVLRACADGTVSHIPTIFAAAAPLLRAPPAVAEAVAVAFRAFFLELLARLLDDAGAVHTLGAWAGVFEEAYPLIEAHLQRHYARGLPTDVAHLWTRLRLLRAAPLLAHDLGWPAAPLYCVFADRARPTTERLLALECYAVQAQLSAAAHAALRDAWIGDAPAPLDVDGTSMDVRAAPIFEQARIDRLWHACAAPLPPTPAPLYVSAADLSPSTALIGSLLWPAARGVGGAPPTPFVSTHSTEAAVRDTLLHVSLRLPLVVRGPPASGKTHLLQALAHRCAARSDGLPPCLSIPLGDQSGVDAKALLGSYVSSRERPGTFSFVEGALTRAVRAGLWVVLEDIDKASSDVLSVIAPLAEALGPTKPVGARPTLDLGAHGRVVAARGFALLATRTVRADAPRAQFLSSEHWGEVALPAPHADDVQAIVCGRFPRVASLPDDERACLVQAWADAVRAARDAPSSVRRPTLRELMQWCERIEAMDVSSVLASPAVQEAVFLDACDVFLASFASATPLFHAMARAIGSALQLSDARATYAWQARVPDMAVGPAERVRVGRVALERLAPGAPSPLRYALTRPALLGLERLAACVAHAEPALLVGETGTGKTTMVQVLAHLLGQPLTVVNLSQQTESGDLLGAYKPLDPRVQAADVHNAWTRVFEQTFSVRRNAAYMDAERRAFQQGRWARLAKLWTESCTRAQRELAQREPHKRRRTDGTLEAAWAALATRAAAFAALFATARRPLALDFVEGPLVRAVREGHWLLLDEINLAAPETLDCLAPLLQSRESSLVLTERGDLTPVPRHAHFRLFACMNPATDVGKRDLAPSVRARFTELYVPSPDADRDALVGIVQKYMGAESVGDQAAVLDVAEWYTAVRRLAAQHELADGANQRPPYSVRTLARALTFATTLAPAYGLRRALAEGVWMAFGMLLDAPSAARLQQVTQAHLLARTRDARVRPGFVPPCPGAAYVQVGAFWLATGPLEPAPVASYVLTPSVEAKVHALARALVTRQSPVLIQGPTSAGKTSAVAYLAQRTGHRFVRINNHEHTDVQEYLGAYATNADGQLVFTEGLLVTALRRGDWLVLDELNLAPTDVLEALNRLLDDNRELRLPETGEVVRPHPHFMLFATQNPPGAYAGRKVLSRAFRNRFVEVHFDDVPPDELATILTQRCAIAPSYAAQMVAVFRELQRRRESERVFERHAFATLRDLFRWGRRAAVGYEQLADTGYMLLAERTRHPRDRATVQAVLEDVLRVRIDVRTLYDGGGTLGAQLGAPRMQQLRDAAQHHGIVWTSAMRRLVGLAAAAVHYEEPVLLVGETGAGKTSVCDVLATAFARPLRSVSCHQNTDSADLLGGQRPLRDRSARAAEARAKAAAVLGDVPPTEALDAVAARLAAAPPSDAQAAALRDVQGAQALFTWCDGPLVEAMRAGEHLLLDEISLADDSVLERLNSVLEPERTLVLAEKAGADVDVRAAPGFQVVATMNPGGDYGKKELSPALRNRFTEVYVPPVDDPADQAAIVQALLPPALHVWTPPMLALVQLLAHQLGGAEHTGLGVRDLVGWAHFLREATARGLVSAPLAFAHGAALTVIDALGALPATAAMPASRVQALRVQCYAAVNAAIAPAHLDPTDPALYAVHETATAWGVGPFAIAKGPHPPAAPPFTFAAPTTAANALRVLRACAVRGRSVLLEGSPGAGKTSLVASLAAQTGHELVRINLSEQTELVDLFGAELPVEHGRPGEFAWRPAAFLDAMQRGAWVLLDEMNLAPQAVLEGLNSCLDHRGAVYVAEIGRTFSKHADFRLFAAQNPQHQGGARKGLPKSLLNRFIHVYVAELHADDVRAICAHMYPALHTHLDAMVAFNDALHRATSSHALGRHGAPWEFNLRDLLRWLHVLATAPAPADPLDALSYLYLARFRTPDDRRAAARLFEQCFARSAAPALCAPPALLAPTHALLGRAHVARAPGAGAGPERFALVPSQLACLEGMAVSVRLGLLTIVTGPAGAGKSSVVRLLAALAGHPLETVRLSAASDTSDVLGTFEQGDPAHRRRAAAAALAPLLARVQARAATSDGAPLDALERVRAEIDAHPEHARALAPYLHADERAALDAALAPLAQQAPTAGHFAWVDGPLVRAAQAGHWLLLEHANLCAASVLDRLNSLFEPDGALVLSERGLLDGQVPRIVPHPAFRVFMTVDPRHGELSRAMRNRGMELWLDPGAAAPLAPLARAPSGLAGSLVEQAVHAHRLRRAEAAEDLPAPTPQRAALAQGGVAEPALPGAAFVWAYAHDAPHREAALVYAAQALTPAERALAVRMGLPLPPWRAPPHALADLAPPDTRRVPALAHLADARAASALALPVRAALCADGLAAWAATTPWVRDGAGASDWRAHVAALEACVALARTPPPTERAACLLDALLDHVRFVYTACGGAAPDYARLHMAARGVRAALVALGEHGVAPAPELVAAVHRIHAPRSTRGAAMPGLWQAALPRVPPEAWALLARLETYAADVLPGAAATTALEVLGTLHLWTDAWPAAQAQALAETVHALVRLDPQGRAPRWPEVARAAPAALWMLTHDAAAAPLAPRLQAVLRLAAEHRAAPPATMVGAQLRAWSSAHALTPGMHLAAARALWYADGSFSTEAPGAHAWRCAVLLPAVLDAAHRDRLALCDADAYDAHRRALGQVVACALPHAQAPRLEPVAHALRACAWAVCGAVRDALAALALPALRGVDERLAQAVDAQDLPRVCAALRDAHAALGDAPLSPLVQAWCSWLEALQATAPDAPAASLARLWVRLGTWTLEAYVPDVPLDPVAEAHAHSAYAATVHERLAQQHDVECAADEVRTGGAGHGVLAALRAAMADALRAQRGAQSTRVLRVPDAPRLARVHAEWTTLTAQLLARERVERLVARLADGVEAAHAEEAALQAALAAWEARMRRQYADLSDLTRPVLFALEQVRIGVRLARAPVFAPARTARLLAAATRFPRVAAAQALLAEAAAPRAVATAVPELLAALASAAHEAHATARPVRAATLRPIYDALLVLWAQQREAERQDAEKAAQLFVFQGEDASDEQARLDAEMRALFPVYDDVLEPGDAPRARRAAPRMDEATVRLVYDLHTLLHPGTLPLPTVRARPSAAEILTRQCDELVRCMATGAPLPAALDGAAAYMLARLQRGAAADGARNFYHDAQPAELARMAPLLARLRERVGALLGAMPEQVQLQQLAERVERVAALDCASPVAKALAAIEQLLTHVDDWETYASSALSLRAHAAELTALVVEWRRQELHGWSSLLDDEAAREEARVAPWLFTLYEATTRAGTAALRGELVALLDSYVRESSAGQLSARLRLLDTLSVHLASDDPGTSRLLHHMAAYFAQFVPAVEAQVAAQRTRLERQMADYVRLASWRDVNVYALKQSAQKTHAYLHKTLRQFREVLQQPADPLLALHAEARPSVAVRPLVGAASRRVDVLRGMQPRGAVAPSADASRAPHMQAAERTVARLRALCADTLQPPLASTAYEAVVEFGTTVLETADDLAQQTPALATEANAKRLKSLASQKRRAWAELLQALRRMGLSPFLTPERHAHNHDPARVYGVCALPPHEALGTDAMHAYHAAMLACLARLRLAVQTPAGDVPELPRGVAFVEHAVFLALQVRERLGAALQGATRVWAMAQRLCALAGPLQSVSPTERLAIECRADTLARAAEALTQLAREAPDAVRASPLGGDVPLARIEEWGARVQSAHARLAAVCATWATSSLGLLTASEVAVVQDSTQVLLDVHGALAALGREVPGVQVLTAPLCAWLGPACEPLALSDAPASGALQAASDRVCSSVLVIVQELQGQEPPAADDEPCQLLAEAERIHALDRTLRPNQVADAMCEALALAGSGDVTSACVGDMARFVAPYAELLGTHLAATSLWFRALMRLCVVLSVIMTTLAQKGFCQPPDEDEAEGSDASGEGGEALEGGTGLGDGTGAKDVSDTLQDDEQMEELQNGENENDDRGESQGEDKARETDDMDGDVHSVDGEQEAGQSDGEEAQEKEVEDEVGDVDPLDPDAVDEKMWGAEPEQETQGESEAQGTAGDDREQAGERQEADAERPDAGDDAGDADDADDGEAQPELEDMPDRNDGLGRELDQEAHEEEMQLGELDMPEGDEEPGDDDVSLDEEEEDAAPEDTPNEDLDGGVQAPEADSVDPAAEQGMDQDQAEDGDKADEADKDMDEDAGPDTDVQEDAEPGMEAQEDAEPGTDQPEAERGGDDAAGPRDVPAPPAMPRTLGDVADDAMEYDATHEGGGDDAGGAAGAQERAIGDSDDLDGSSAAQGGGAPQSAPEAGASGADDEARPNPVQSLGDALEQFRRDVEQIREASQHDEAPPTRDDGVPEASEMEHVAPDDEADTQALGTADEQQAQAMKNLSVADAEQGETTMLPDAPENEPMPEEPRAPAATEEAEALGTHAHSTREGALAAADVREDADAEASGPVRDEEVERLDDETRAHAETAVLHALEAFRASDADVARAAELWRSYSALTMDLAFGLCEQLRLILAPTLATRLNGDYRTGKRLNMRKIIPFIASDFAKDKIWLRRTKPSAREYQVLLAIDDSKSMADSRNIHLAYQTLALVAGALTRLEIGDIGICRFGASMEMLHEFGSSSFSDQHGGHILSQLQFQQTSTDMQALLTQSMDVLRDARQRHASVSAADLWQLAIVISDGVCQDHARLKALLRRATEERIMMVFVVVDAGADGTAPGAGEAPRSSILEMNQVSYHTDAAGKLQLDMKRYIDTFPFEYYVIVRDVQSLPHVLATTLRQWAERIRDA